ncbi:hypothetical protein [Nitrosomonas communis]|uniref:Uncharacterized protein n=1 Tax=Nitrosomonas communis TaxID=44574 RepID=A0A1I4QJ02_9PROT|nr:hypothetical protein [Nitrosomonas communis]SFM40041.1 hypothetical protein SAMN05421863_10273 [Nitrosomonas communis]
MSLIVARQINDEIFVIADTKFTVNGADTTTQAEQYIGGLKVVILAPGLFVAFAGNIEYARQAIERIYDKGLFLFDKNQVIDYFLYHHNRAEHQTDFIVGVIVEKRDNPAFFEKELFKIANGKVQWEKQVTHIGDIDAYSKFQSFFHSEENKSPVPTFEISRLGKNKIPEFHAHLAKSMNAMMQVIDDPNISSIDGIRTVVISEENQFYYIEYLQVRGNPIPIRNEPNSPVYFGGAAEGSDIKHVGLYTGIGLGIFPVFFESGKFGLIYHPESSFKPTILRCNSENEFLEYVKKSITIAHERALLYQERVDNHT